MIVGGWLGIAGPIIPTRWVKMGVFRESFVEYASRAGRGQKLADQDRDLEVGHGFLDFKCELLVVVSPILEVRKLI
jgi:hypothetical protein